MHADAIILGASKMPHLTENMAGALAGPLEPAVVEAFDRAWHMAQPTCPTYFR
jgi:aflatoxin B1 aldehyde reductase